MKIKRINIVAVEFKDRSTKFKFGYLKATLNLMVRVETVEESGKSYMEKLVKDPVSIVIRLVARIYSRRSQKFKKIKRS